MSSLEIAALVAGYALALARLLNAAKLLWSWVPTKLQPLLPALVTVLPLLASQLGAATTKLDIAESLVLALGALTTAVRGQHPVPPPLLVLFFLGFVSVASACTPAVEQLKAAEAQLPCDDAKLRAIDRQHVERVSKTCLLKYSRTEDCPEYPALVAQHRAELRAECAP